MGSFAGHILPGTIFLVMGIWSLYRQLERYFLHRKHVTLSTNGKEGSRPYRTCITFSSSCCPNFPAEETTIIIVTIIGSVGEFVTAFEGNGEFRIGNAQHITMYMFFNIAASISILRHYRYPLPADIEYICMSLAYFIEGLLFFYHLHGRPHMDVQVHIFLVYVTGFSTVAALVEMKYRHNVIPALARAYFTCLQGTWFYQVAFILYPPFGPTWDVNDHMQIMLTTLIYAWHYGAMLGLGLLLGFIAYFKVKVMSPSEVLKNLEMGRVGLRASRDASAALHGKCTDHCKYMIVSSDDEEV
uniref:Transmembrane protein n=1 Tax=Hirondellea gigas TaxID=1518452 RepID=A0A6A7GB76_9CRUS